MYVRLSVCFYLLTFDRVCVLPLCSLNRCILFSVFYVLPSDVINDDDDDNYTNFINCWGKIFAGRMLSANVCPTTEGKI